MAKDKSVKAVKSKDTKVATSNGVKHGRVTKPADTPKAKAQETAKSAAKAVTSSKGSKTKPAKKVPEPESSDDSSEESNASEDEATSVSSDSSDESEEEAPVKKRAAKTNGAAKAAKPAADDSDDSDDSSEASDDEPAKAAADEDDSSDASDSSDDEEEVKPAANGSKKAAAKDDEEDDDEDDDDDDDEDSSDDDEEEEEKKPAPAAASKKRKAEDQSEGPKKRYKHNGEEVGEPSKNLFVGGLSWNVDEEWLAREFEGFGEIVGCRVITRPEDGKSKGYGYVEFGSIEHATAALDAKQGAELDGRNINVDFGKPRPDRSYNRDQVSDRASKFGDRQPNEPSATLFVGNISFNATQDNISETFGEYGSVNAVRLPTDQETGVMKGYGYVEFSSVEEATAAYEALNGADIAGRNIRLDYAAARPAGGFGDSPRGGRGRGGFGDRGGRGGRGGRGRGGFGDRGGRGGGFRGGRGGSTNRGGFGDFKGNKTTF